MIHDHFAGHVRDPIDEELASRQIGREERVHARERGDRGGRQPHRADAVDVEGEEIRIARRVDLRVESRESVQSDADLRSRVERDAAVGSRVNGVRAVDRGDERAPVEVSRRDAGRVVADGVNVDRHGRSA
ncbi:hypothetical protein D3C83_38380 [compost metagenome]